MERLTKLLLIAVILICIPVMTIAATQDTEAATIMTNKAIASYSNSGGTLYTNKTQGTNVRTVDTIFGIYLTDTTVSTLYTSPSIATYHVVKISNEGNSPINMLLTTNGFSYGGSSGAAWSGAFIRDDNQSGTWNAGEVTTVTSMTLGEDAAYYVLFKVIPSADAADNSLATNTVISTISNYFGFSTYTSYTGFNTVVYAGPTNAQRITITIVQGPSINVVKTSFVTNSASYIALGGGGNDFVPGAQVIYAINWTNSGSGTAFNLNFSDSIDSNFEYMTNSIKYVDNAKQDATWGNYTGAAGPLTDANDAESEGSWALKGWTNAGAVNFTYGTNIGVPANARGTLFFKVILK